MARSLPVHHPCANGPGVAQYRSSLFQKFWKSEIILPGPSAKSGNPILNSVPFKNFGFRKFANDNAVALRPDCYCRRRPDLIFSGQHQERLQKGVLATYQMERQGALNQGRVPGSMCSERITETKFLQRLSETAALMWVGGFLLGRVPDRLKGTSYASQSLYGQRPSHEHHRLRGRD